MVRSFTSLLFPILFCFLLPEANAQKYTADTSEASLTRDWTLQRIEYPGGKTRDLSDSLYTLHLSSTDSFFYSTGKDKELTGEWTSSRDSIHLFPDTPPLDAGKTPAFILFQRNGEGHLAIGSLNRKELELEMNGKRFIFDSGAPRIHSGLTFYSVFRGLIGMATILGLGFLFSSNRRAIDWSLVMKGLLLQLVLAVLILKVPFVESIFEWISDKFVGLISFANVGSDFLFRSQVTGEVEPAMVNFITRILPSIIFFSALTSMFYYLGVLQRIVYGFAWLMKRVMKLSGAESLAAAGNVFLGQTEAPFLIKPYLPKMTRSEIMCLMSGGMATIAGGVLVAYIGFLGGDDPEQRAFFAKHLLTASVMSAPAAIVASKLLVPETEDFDKELVLDDNKFGANVLEAITNGTGDGLKLAVNVAAMLLVFLALIALGNAILENYIGHYTGLNEWIQANTENYDGFTFQFIIGYLFSPIAWLMGVAQEDIVLVGQLLGEKTIVNEFVAYKTLGEMKASSIFAEQKSIIMATYILCGFANFASIGIQIGGIGALIPNRKGLLSKLGIRSLIGGTLACLFTAVIVGMLGVS